MSYALGVPLDLPFWDERLDSPLSFGTGSNL